MSSIQYQTYLADVLREAGLTVVEEPGWKLRSQPSNGRDYRPIGILNHHTAPPNPYPVERLYKSCNLFIAQDGTVHVVAAGYQWDSGSGSVDVLHQVMAQAHPGRLAKDQGFTASPISGNPYFIDIEVDHPGNGSHLNVVQFEALVWANFAILRHKGWPVQQVLGHAEWTSRKTDPHWDGTWRPMPLIRATVQFLLEEDMARFKDVTEGHTFYADVEWLAEQGLTHGINPPANDLFGPDEVVTRGQLAAFLHRLVNKLGDAS